MQPIFSAIDCTAAHCDGYSAWWSKTSRTARSWTSGEYRFDVFFMTPSSQRMEPPGIPGRFKDNGVPGLRPHYHANKPSVRDVRTDTYVGEFVALFAST